MRVLQECYKSVTRVSQESHKSVTRVLQECYKCVAIPVLLGGNGRRARKRELGLLANLIKMTEVNKRRGSPLW
jgi:hypothetical protein